MESDVIIKDMSERYARTVMDGEEMCCPTGYGYDYFRTFIPQSVLKMSYGCGKPIEICSNTYRVLEHEFYRLYFAMLNRASVSGLDDAIICEPTGGCCQCTGWERRSSQQPIF